jgi:histidinol-phosphate phosphatase family protein
LAELAKKGLRSVALRYFNAAGAEPLLRVGEWHEPESHLIPRVLRNSTRMLPCEIFGTDYPTPDGTCVRDYVHVWDLAAAHGAALELLFVLGGRAGEKGSFRAFNLGSENGSSVREVIDVCGEATGVPIRRVERERRAGDPPYLVSDSSLARKELGFRPESSGLPAIVDSAWAWERQRSQMQAPARTRAVFLDRDGTLNEDPGYLSEPSLLRLLPGVGESLARLKAAGFLLIVVSNQSGVARGLIPEGSLKLVHARLDELVAEHGATVDRYELCVHHPDDDCECRKPKPKLILDAARALGVDIRRSYMIGDKESDVAAGIRAGCRGSILVRTGEGSRADSEGAAFLGDSLVEAVDWILKHRDSESESS